MCRFPKHLQERNYGNVGFDPYVTEHINIDRHRMYRVPQHYELRGGSDINQNFSSTNLYHNDLKYMGRYNKKSHYEKRFVKTLSRKNNKRLSNNKVERANKRTFREAWFRPAPPVEEEQADEDAPPCEALNSPRFVKVIELKRRHMIRDVEFPEGFFPFYPKLGPAQFYDEETASNLGLLTTWGEPPESEFAGLLLGPSRIIVDLAFREKELWCGIPLRYYRKTREFKMMLAPYRSWWSRSVLLTRRLEWLTQQTSGIKKTVQRMFAFERALECLLKDPPIRENIEGKVYTVTVIDHGYI